MLVVAWVVLGALGGWVVTVHGRRAGVDARLGCLTACVVVLVSFLLQWTGLLPPGASLLVLAGFALASGAAQARLGKPAGFGTRLQWTAVLALHFLMAALSLVGALASCEDRQS